MKTIALLYLLLAPILGPRQDPTAPSPGASAELEAVLSQMDKVAPSFKSAQADFEWDNYQKVVDETERQTGQVYFRRNGANVEAMFDFTSPHPKQVLFKDGKLILYDKKIDQITEHETGTNKADVEAFLSLGFGGRGHELLKNYEVKMDDWETVDGTKVAKLELISKLEKVRNMFNQFILWIDPKQDVPIRQQVLEPGGDYWLAHYTNIKLNTRIPDDVFRIKTTSHTKVVKTQ